MVMVIESLIETMSKMKVLFFFLKEYINYIDWFFKY